jgi:hypothetical protein
MGEIWEGLPHCASKTGHSFSLFMDPGQPTLEKHFKQHEFLLEAGISYASNIQMLCKYSQIIGPVFRSECTQIRKWID